MKVNYLHHHTDFKDLLAIVAEQKSIDPYLVEKDYWIMHCLFGLQQLGVQFELKGGTSLSKAYKIIDNKALQVPCYHIGYTFVEKLQTIVTKYRNMIESGNYQVNFMRQYYDIFHLLQQQEVNDFIGTDEYHKHKENRFPKVDYEIALANNQAFLLENTDIRSKLAQLYSTSKGLYYNGQPQFESMLADIKKQLHRL